MKEIAQTFGWQQYLTFLGCIVLGQFFHLIVKANSLRKKSFAASKPFSLVGDFLKVDSLEISGSLVACIVVMVAYSELIGFYPKIALGQKIFFMLLGYSGSSWVLAAFSKADKVVLKTIDTKTNELDEILNNKKEEMEYIWELSYWNDEDLFDYQSSSLTPAMFAQITYGTIDTGAKTITYDKEPAFSQVTVLIKGDPETTEIAAPIRRPK